MSKMSPLESFVSTSWTAFNGAVLAGGDGKEECEVVLYYALRPAMSGFYSIVGKTGQGHGHAEMDALHQFVSAFGVAAFDNYMLRMDCTSKPCCARCSVVMGFLGIMRANSATTKSRKCMGSTQWAVSMTVRDLIKAKGQLKVFEEFMNIDNKFVNAFLA